MADGIDGLHIPRDAFIDRSSLLLDRSTTSHTKLVFDDSDHACHVVTTTDVQPLIEINKTFQNSGSDGYSASRSLKYVAEIPIEVFTLWNQQEGCNVLAKENRHILKRLLNDPDNRAFRTGLGRV